MPKQTIADAILETLGRHGEMKRIDLYRASPVLLASFNRSLQRAKSNGFSYPLSTAPEQELRTLMKAGWVIRTRPGYYQLAEGAQSVVNPEVK